MKIFLYFLHSKLKLESRGTGVGYKITPAEVRKRPTFPGLFWLPTLCGIFPNFFDHPSFHNTIRTSPIISSSIHLPDCFKCSPGFIISRLSIVTRLHPSFYGGRPPFEFHPSSYKSQIPVEFLQWMDHRRTSTASSLLRTSTVSEFHPSFYCKRISSELLL